MDYILSEPQSLVNLPNDSDIIDHFTGLSKNGKAGTEMMYNRIVNGIGSEYLERFQIICSRARKLESNKKKIFWLHDLADDPEVKRLSSTEFRNNFDQLIFVSYYQFESYHQKLGVPYDKSLVLRNAIVPIENHTKPDDGIVRLIYHATPKKGLQLLIPVFKEVVKVLPNIQLDVYSSHSIYGWSHLDDPYQGIFEECRNHPQINYHGVVSNEEIREALKQAHIFAYPNIFPETSSLATIEAMSAGCLVVAPDLAVLPETLSNFGFMYRFTEDRSEHMSRFANSLVNAVQNLSNLKAHLINQSNFANSIYNLDSRVAQWKKLLDNL